MTGFFKKSYKNTRTRENDPNLFLVRDGFGLFLF